MTEQLRVPKAEIGGLKGGVVKRMVRRKLGAVPEGVEVMWHNPKVLMGSARFGRTVEAWDECDSQLKVLAHMAVSALIGCRFCLDFAYYSAHHEGLDLAKAREVPRWRDSPVFTPVEQDVLEYAEAMSQAPPTVTDDLAARLLAALGPAALVELTAFIGFSNSTTRTNVALGIPSAGLADSCQLPPLAERRTEDAVAA